jgi:isopropylmalate/homocitrate/citramalate synthase
MDIQIYEMFMRDGLQSLDKIYSLEDKKFFIDCLIKCNIKNIEFGSTTNPKLLYQMKDFYKLWNYLNEKNLNNNLIMLIKFTLIYI